MMRTRELSAINIRAVAQIGVIILLLLACFKIIQPFLGALIWAIVIAISTWPAFNRLTAWLGQRPRTAATLIVITMLLALVAPLSLMVLSLVDTLPQMTLMFHQFISRALPQAPDWLTGIPLVGSTLQSLWQSALSDLPRVLGKVKPAVNEAALWSLGQGAQVGIALLEIVLAMVGAGFLLLQGEAAWRVAELTINRLGGTAAVDLPDVIARTVRSVMAGVLGTALVQALLCTIGLVISGVPGYLVLGFLCFVLAIAQLPTLIIWIPAAAWLLYSGATGYGIFLLVWCFVLVNTIDNFIKPLLISQGAKLPLTLIFLGVIGGLWAWGIIGLFIGPTLLAVNYTLFQHWLSGSPPSFKR